ncbi:hypothetical protein EDB19DRAFT_2024559 [Suillus lakei]|nr:hypothetical protein EDB19DRAFT_2024559 [Suillus lakei]
MPYHSHVMTATGRNESAEAGQIVFFGLQERSAKDAETRRRPLTTSRANAGFTYHDPEHAIKSWPSSYSFSPFLRVIIRDLLQKIPYRLAQKMRFSFIAVAVALTVAMSSAAKATFVEWTMLLTEKPAWWSRVEPAARAARHDTTVLTCPRPISAQLVLAIGTVTSKLH